MVIMTTEDDENDTNALSIIMFIVYIIFNTENLDFKHIGELLYTNHGLPPNTIIPIKTVSINICGLYIHDAARRNKN